MNYANSKELIGEKNDFLSVFCFEVNSDRLNNNLAL